MSADNRPVNSSFETSNIMKLSDTASAIPNDNEAHNGHSVELPLAGKSLDNLTSNPGIGNSLKVFSAGAKDLMSTFNEMGKYFTGTDLNALQELAAGANMVDTNAIATPSLQKATGIEGGVNTVGLG